MAVVGGLGLAYWLRRAGQRLGGQWQGGQWLGGETAMVGITGTEGRFLALLVAELGERPDCKVQQVLPNMAGLVLSMHGQEVPVPLAPLFRHHQAFPDELSGLVDELLQDIREEALEQPKDHLFVDAASLILPQVCNSDWVRENAPTFGDASLVHRELAEDVWLCYVIDTPQSVVFVCQQHLQLWNLGEEDLFHLANQNLQHLATTPIPMPNADEAVVVKHGDGYDAARVLLLDPDEVEGLLVAMPERGTLWLGQEKPHDLEAMMSVTEEQSRNAEHPISPRLFRMQDRRLVPVTEPHP